MESRVVDPGRGWKWIVEGFRLFLRSPAIWIALVLILYMAMKVVQYVPLLALVAVLLMPVFLAGLMDGCRALEEGRRLEIAHLMKGFRRNPAQLVTIGGVSLVGNLAILMIVMAIGGDAFATMAKTLAKSPTVTPQVAGEMQAATLEVTRAALVGAAISLPLLMALWFAPLLTYFHDVKPWQALKSSFLACLKNFLPFLVYGLVLLAALMVLVPVGIQFGQYDLGLWLMAPVLLPSIYASYKDIYAARPASAGRDSPLLG